MATVQDFDFSVDLLQAILWQYDNASRLKSLAVQKSEWYAENQQAFWSAWVRDVFNLQTANDFGLAVWARILNVPLVASVPASEDRPVFGFGEHNLNFYDGNFGRDTSGTVNLSTEQKRLVLRLRYFQLVSNGTVPEINAFLRLLFGEEGTVYVLDSLDMSYAVYVFDFIPSSSVLFVLEQFDLLPRPAGVGTSILVAPGESFGFAPYYLNFENSNFGA
jgi:hypothetical protein